METMKTIVTRRSVRLYKTEQIPEEALNEILAAGSIAAMGMKAYDRLHMAVIQSEEALGKLNEGIGRLMAKVMPGRGNGNFLMGAPTVVIVSALDPDKCPMKGMHYINSGCVAENIMLAAADKGIGSVVLGIAGDVVKNDSGLKKELGIPEEFTPLFAIALGYRADEAPEKTLEQRITVSLV